MNWLTISKMLDRIGTFEMKNDSGLVERKTLLITTTIEDANIYCNRKYGRDLTPQEITDIQTKEELKFDFGSVCAEIIDEVVEGNRVPELLVKPEEEIINAPVLAKPNELIIMPSNPVKDMEEELIEKDDTITQGDEDESKN